MNKIHLGPFTRLAVIAILGVSACCAGPFATAQNAQGSILGHITDSTGAVVVNATITITNLKTGVVKNLTTSNSGDYTVPQLDPGTYSVQIVAAGFKPEVSSDLIVEVDHALRQDFKLNVGNALSETVTVTAEGQMLHTDDATIGQVVSGELMEILPDRKSVV